MPSSHLILGGGIYGASIGYYLAQRGAPSIILESQPEAALTASGKAAGFLGGSWGDGRVTERLHRTSFEIHEQLAKDLGIKSYRKMSAFRVGDGGSSSLCLRNRRGRRQHSCLQGPRLCQMSYMICNVMLKVFVWILSNPLM